MTEEQTPPPLADRVYGEADGPTTKPGRGSHEMEQRMIPDATARRAVVVCAGVHQIVISNS